MATPRLAIVEDESNVSSFLKRGLEACGFKTEIISDAMGGEGTFLQGIIDCIIVDIGIANGNGHDVCKVIRKRTSKTPILMMSSKSSIEDKLKGFDSGADDYLVKPFEFRELVARINSLIRRAKPEEESVKGVLEISDLVLNSERKIVTRNNRRIVLTVKEFQLLEYLLQNKGKIVTRAEIAQNIWDIRPDTKTNIIEVYINFLRKKVDKMYSTKLIHTHVGIGYEIKEEESYSLKN